MFPSTGQSSCYLGKLFLSMCDFGDENFGIETSSLPILWVKIRECVFVSYLQQCLSNLRVLWTIKVQHLGAQAVVVGSHLVQVHHIRVSVEHGPPALSVHLGKLNRQHLPLLIVQSLGEPQRQLHLCTLSTNRNKMWDLSFLGHQHAMELSYKVST